MSTTAASRTSLAGATGSQEPVVVCQQLTKTFKDFWMRDHARAVQGLSFEIQPREVFGLLGPNGSGKSTTIKMILGLLTPTSGRVAVFSKAPNDVTIKRRIGYLPEESYMYGFLNARETLQYYAKLFELDYKTRERRIDELLDMLGMTGAQFRSVREYSKGMQRRLGIAQALINDPDFLILDEPTTGLDPIGTKQIKDLIIELGRRGKTILLSSHLLADVEDCVDRLVILYGGTKRAEGTCDSLLVTQERTTLETDELDDATIAEIDAIVQRRTGGAKSIRKVSKPRQSLEALFLDIVEQAKQEQVSTSGATAGGTTASFLREGEVAQDDAQAAAIIERLSAPVEAPASQAAAQPTPSQQAKAQSDDVIGSLLKGEKSVAAQAQAATPPPPPPPPARTEGVDLSVIGKLMDGAPGKADDAGRRENPR